MDYSKSLPLLHHHEDDPCRSENQNDADYRPDDDLRQIRMVIPCKTKEACISFDGVAKSSNQKPLKTICVKQATQIELEIS